MKITKGQLKTLISETISNTLNEGHGLSDKDVEYLEKVKDETEDKKLKRIIKFILKSNVEVKTKKSKNVVKNPDAKRKKRSKK